VQAAEGWLELKNYQEAHLELDRVSAENSSHPEVLALRCRIHEATREWEDLLDSSKSLSALAPKCLVAWLGQGRALHELGKTHQAYHLLVDVVELFPGNQTIRYDIACYAAQRGLVHESLEWLRSVFESDGDYFYRGKALRDQMLLPLWKEDAVWASLRALF
jgi:tetratricopeptide (TPR) repeat protein